MSAAEVIEPVLRAAIYCRISRDSEKKGAGVARQARDCKEHAERFGWCVEDHRVYVDNDVSATSGAPRPQYLRLLDDLKAGRIDAVVAWHPDRLHRSPRELEDFIDLVQAAEVKVSTVMAGDYDLATSTGRMTARIVGSVARKEAEHTAERTKEAHAELAEEGRDSGGPRPYGFEADRVTIRDDEAAVLREAAERVLIGDGLTTITRDWNSRGVPTVTEERRRQVVELAREGVPYEGIVEELGLPSMEAVERELQRKPVQWYPRVLRRMLLAPRTAGMRVHHGEVTGQAEWDPILDRETYEAVRGVLTDPSRRKTKPNRKYLLTGGLLRCGRCGWVMGSHPSNGRRGYRCRYGPGQEGCGRRNVTAEPVEKYVAEAVLAALESERLTDLLAVKKAGKDDAAIAQTELAELEEKLERAQDAYVEGLLERSKFARIVRKHENERQALQRRIGSLSKHPGLARVPAGEQVREWWGKSSLERRHALIAAVVDRVVVNDPVVVGLPEFDPRRIDIDWKG